MFSQKRFTFTVVFSSQKRNSKSKQHEMEQGKEILTEGALSLLKSILKVLIEQANVGTIGGGLAGGGIGMLVGSILDSLGFVLISESTAVMIGTALGITSLTCIPCFIVCAAAGVLLGVVIGGVAYHFLRKKGEK